MTAIDVSGVALAEAETAAGEAGVTVRWVRQDVADALPAGPFELVTSAFLHSPVDLPRTAILRAAAARVAPGGTLLTIGHAPSDEHPHAELETAAQTLAALGLDGDDGATWTVETCEERERTHTFAGDDHAHARVDAILRLRRAGA